VSHTGQRRVSARSLEDSALSLGRDLRIKEFFISSGVGVPMTARP
jgi:hypothetical protein